MSAGSFSGRRCRLPCDPFCTACCTRASGASIPAILSYPYGLLRRSDNNQPGNDGLCSIRKIIGVIAFRSRLHPNAAKHQDYANNAFIQCNRFYRLLQLVLFMVRSLTGCDSVYQIPWSIIAFVATSRILFCAASPTYAADSGRALV